MSKQAKQLFIYSNGRVAAINSTNGEITWEVKLKDYIKSSLSHAVGSIYADTENLYVGVSGIVVCLKAKDGSFVWKNELKGWGYNFVSIANVAADPQAGAAQANAAAMAAIGVTTSAT